MTQQCFGWELAGWSKSRGSVPSTILEKKMSRHLVCAQEIPGALGQDKSKKYREQHMRNERKVMEGSRRVGLCGLGDQVRAW